MKIKYPLITIAAIILLIVANNEIAKFKTFRYYKNVENIIDPLIKELEKDEFLCDETEATTYVINLWATWCQPCQKEMPVLNKLVGKYETESTLFLAISNEKEKTVLDWVDLQKNEPEYFMLYENQRLINYLFTLNPDKEIKKGRYPELLPTNLIIHNGELRYFEQGFSEENIAKMDSVLKNLY